MRMKRRMRTAWCRYENLKKRLVLPRTEQQQRGGLLFGQVHAYGVHVTTFQQRFWHVCEPGQATALWLRALHGSPHHLPQHLRLRSVQEQ